VNLPRHAVPRLIFAALRDAAWLHSDRARAYARLTAAGMAVALAYGWLSIIIGYHPGTSGDGTGRPAPTDFLAFWTAGRFALQGHVANAYDLTALRLAEVHATVLEPGSLLAFFYPPPFLLLCLPFAALPYLVGFFTFVGVQTAVLVVLLRRILPPDWGYLPVMAFPGLLMNAATGQNGFVSAACFAGALLLLARQPALAGACLGVLVVKPHLALAVPVALFCARRWSALIACGLVAAGIALLSLVLLGAAAWQGFLGAAPAIRAALEQHPEDWGKLQSLFTSVRWAGAPLGWAYAVQAALAVCVLAALAGACLRRPGPAAEIALVAAAAMLCTPHLLDYDLAVVGVPLAWLAREASATGWRPWEKLVGALVYGWPMVGRIATDSYHLGVTPLLLLVFFGLLWRRAVSSGVAA
jgi:alpha-1,2-mannosyltransferase